MLIRKLEVERYHKFRREFIHAAEGPDNDVSDDDVASAYLSERSGPHRGRPTPIEAVRDELMRMGVLQTTEQRIEEIRTRIEAASGPADGVGTSPSLADMPEPARWPEPIAVFDIDEDGNVTEIEGAEEKVTERIEQTAQALETAADLPDEPDFD